MSRPSRAHGLKQPSIFRRQRLVAVAPLAGAWIETAVSRGKETNMGKSRPSRARGLKLNGVRNHSPDVMSRPSRARGLKQSASPDML